MLLMSDTDHFVSRKKAPLPVQTNKIESREWWLWGFAVIVTLGLTVAIMALVYPGLNLRTDSEWLALKDWVRGLAALVLLFDIYTAYQHLQLSHMRRQLAERNELFRLITENAADMIAVVDAQGHRLYNSPAYEKILGYSPGELKGTEGFEQIHPDDRERVRHAADNARTSGRGERLEYRIRHKDGSWRILESTASAVQNAKGHIERLVIVNRDISDRKRAEELLEFNALHDALTGLPNRALFLKQLCRSFALSRRHQNYNFAVLLLDVDAFKLINDSLGHEAGDELLVQLGARLAASLRALDTVARPGIAEPFDTVSREEALAKLGGDEYAVLLDDIRHPSDAMRVAERLQHSLCAAFPIRGHEIVISASIGVAVSRGDYTEAQDILRDAEIAMHRAKERGKGYCELFDSAMHAQAIRRLRIESELRKGIVDDEFRVFYQPIVDLASERIVAFEALSRWQRADEMIMPGDFIEIADETGLIVPINQRLIADACRRLKSWREVYPAEQPLVMCVNIPQRQFADPNLCAQIAESLGHAALDPDGLELEILETVAMGEPAQALRVLSSLKRIGVRLSLDDFGTGYSSLSRLQHLPVDTVKIDRSFIAQLDTAAGHQMVRTIVLLAHSMGLKVVAEGVETREQHRTLLSLQCDLAQGFLFSRPLPADAIEHLLAGKASAQMCPCK